MTISAGTLALATSTPLMAPQTIPLSTAATRPAAATPWTVAAHGGHHLRRDHRREHQHGSDGQVDTRGDDHERHADAENRPHGDVLGDQREVAGRKEAVARDDGEHQADDDQDAEDPERLQPEDSLQQRVVAVVGPAAGGDHRALFACRAHAARPSSAPVIAPTNVSTLVSFPR